MATYTEIASVTVGSGGASTIDFASIPSTYTDLKIVFTLRSSASTNDCKIEFNGTTANYSERAFYGSGSAAGTFNDAIINPFVNSSSYTANTFLSGESYIPNYAGSAYKSVSTDTVQENNATLAYSAINAALWSNGAAITSIKLTPASGNFAQYSTAYLYGIKKD